MFTGIVQDVGTVTEHRAVDGDVQLWIRPHNLSLATTSLGDSICVHGVCLTVTELRDSSFAVDVSQETLSFTTIAAWREGTHVNLEPALRVGDALGGHFVSGHIDGVARIAGVANDARSVRITVEPPAQLRSYFARKGSVALDGVSLTVNEVAAGSFGVNLIPLTQTATTLGALQAGSLVNLEIDPIARYLERWIEGSLPPSRGLRS